MVGLWPFNFWQKNRTTWILGNGLRFSNPSTAYTLSPPEKLLKIDRFTVLLNLASNTGHSNGIPRILSYSLDDENHNFMIGQWKDGLVFKLRAGRKAKTIYFETEHVFKKGEKTCLAIVFDGMMLSLYQDGKKKNTKHIGPVEFSNWKSSYPLVLGSEVNGKFAWEGSIYSITIFDQALRAEEINTFPTRTKDLAPVLHYSFNNSSQIGGVRDEGKGQPADMSIPNYFQPFKRTILRMPPGSLRGYWRNLGDMFINIVGFVPLGFLLSLYLSQKGFSFAGSLSLSIFTCFGISLMIELTQALLPNRFSGLIDLFANTLGAAIGVFVYKVKKEYWSTLHLFLPREQ